MTVPSKRRPRRVVRTLFPRVDVFIFLYALSLITYGSGRNSWPLTQRACEHALTVARPRIRIHVDDIAERSAAVGVWTRLAPLTCLGGGADIEAQPWTALDGELNEVTSRPPHDGLQIRLSPSIHARPRPEAAHASHTPARGCAVARQTAFPRAIVRSELDDAGQAPCSNTAPLQPPLADPDVPTSSSDDNIREALSR